MDGRSGSGERRRPAVAAAAAVAAIAACTATSPPPLPPRRLDFPTAAQPPAAPPAVIARPLDLPAAAEAPARDESYVGWTLTADVASLFPLAGWLGRPKDVYLAAPALLLVPAIHAAHGEGRSAGISLAMRAAMLGVVYLMARSAEDECASSSSYVCVPIGQFLVGYLAVTTTMTLDSAFLARTQRPASDWDRLPVVSASAGPDGRRLLTLSARF
jgi:hypothetical protein